MIDAAAIGRMRTGAVLVDAGRGGVVDEPALVAALEQGRLGSAGLDVFATEQLPADSALWTLSTVLVSPHTAGLSVHENDRIMALFEENLRRDLAGDELLGRVHPAREDPVAIRGSGPVRRRRRWRRRGGSCAAPGSG